MFRLLPDLSAELSGETSILSGVRIGIVAGEVSGDILGAGLIKALKQKHPESSFVGIGGPRMIAEGCESLYPMERLAVMGIAEVFGRLFEILRIRRHLSRHFIQQPPDIFIGVDAPDFNLVLESRLKSAGIPVVHYVSPTVWAWRSYRARKIGRSVDHMLTLFPFEEVYYKKNNIPVTFVGHPMAENIDAGLDREECRDLLHIDSNSTVVAVLPGSRKSELKRHSDLFVKTMQWLHRRHPDYRFITPFVDHKKREIFEKALKHNHAEKLPFTMVDGQSHQVMAAANIILLVSGTAALEAALLERVMVITYKVSFITAWLVRLLSRVDLYSMPNNLAGKELVPEFIRIQSSATPANLGKAIEQLLGDDERMKTIENQLREIHKTLKQDASDRASDVVLDILKKRSG